MAEKRSTRSNFPSRYGGGWISAAQYVVEFQCEKKAKAEKRELFSLFWKHEEWAKYFRNQIAAANTLLKKYTVYEILAALKDKRAWKTTSLRAPWLVPVLDSYKGKFDVVIPLETINADNIITTHRPEVKANKSLLGKLK